MTKYRFVYDEQFEDWHCEEFIFSIPLLGEQWGTVYDVFGDTPQECEESLRNKIQQKEIRKKKNIENKNKGYTIEIEGEL